MKVKELIEELQKIENKELDVYVRICDEVVYRWWEKWAEIEDKFIETVKLWAQPNRNWPNTPCVILD